MIKLNFYKSKRKRILFNSNLNFEFNQKDIQYLFIKEYKSLSHEEKETIKEFYYSKSKTDFYNLLEYNQIIPFGAHILSELNCDKTFWKSKYEFFFDRNNKIKELLNSIFQKLDSVNCKSITLTENFAVLLSTKSNLGCFSSGDVDLSANIYEKDKIISCLNDFDFYSDDKSNKIGEYSGQSMQFFNKNFLDNGFWINIIWKPVTRAFLIQNRYEKRLDKARINYKLIENTSIRVLCDTELMYFCCLHISAGHYFTLTPGLRLYYDIDRLASYGNIDWNNLKLWEIEDNAGLRISFVLLLSKKILNSKIPENIFNTPLAKFRNKLFLNYLFDSNRNKIQSNSSFFRRLIIELLSDNKNIIFSFFYRFYKYFISK
jgi:hypothetical protein